MEPVFFAAGVLLIGISITLFRMGFNEMKK